MPAPTKETIIEALRPVQDPEMRIGVVDLGLIYDIDISGTGEVRVRMTLTSPGCPYAERLISEARRAVADVEGVEKVEITLVWDPPWNPREMCSDLAKDQLGIW